VSCVGCVGIPDRVPRSVTGAIYTGWGMRSFAVLICLVAATTGAFAADGPLQPLAPPLEKPKPKGPDPHDPGPRRWAGLYFGVNGGAALGHSNWIDSAASSSTGYFAINGASIGATLGFNLQSENLVWGAEADWDWTNLSAQTLTSCPLGCQTEVSWIGTARGRIGYAFQDYFAYMTAGSAFGNLRTATPGVAVVSETKFGWTIGAGFEARFSPQWSAKAEFLHVDLGEVSCGLSCGITVPRNVTFTSDIFRVGINYSFGGPKDRGDNDRGPK